MISKREEFNNCINGLQKRIDLLHLFIKHLDIKEFILLHHGDDLKKTLENASFKNVRFVESYALPYNFYLDDFDFEDYKNKLEGKGIVIQMRAIGRAYLCESYKDKRFEYIKEKVREKMDNVATKFYKKTGIKLFYDLEYLAHQFIYSKYDDSKSCVMTLRFFIDPKSIIGSV